MATPTPTRKSVKCSECGRNLKELRGQELFLLGSTCPHCKAGTFVECKVEDTRTPTRNQGALWGFPRKS